MKGQWDERLKPASFILQGPGAQHVIDPLPVGFDVAVEHRDIGPHPKSMGNAMDVQEAVTTALVMTNFSANALSEHLGTTRRSGRLLSASRYDSVHESRRTIPSTKDK